MPAYSDSEQSGEFSVLTLLFNATSVAPEGELTLTVPTTLNTRCLIAEDARKHASVYVSVCEGVRECILRLCVYVSIS